MVYSLKRKKCFPPCLVVTETVITIHRNEVKYRKGIKEAETSGHGPFHGEILPENLCTRNYREATKHCIQRT